MPKEKQEWLLRRVSLISSYVSQFIDFQKYSHPLELKGGAI
jgi:hypothetical protein